MASVEMKEIGISIGIGQGNFVGTEFIDGTLRLKKTSETESLEPIYVSEGYWESKVIDMVDKFKEYDKIAVTKTQFTNDLYKIETRTSDDGSNFDPYLAISAGGNIISSTKRYIQVKITLYAGYLSEMFTISNFNSTSDVSMWNENKHIETDGTLKLKRKYDLKMNVDTSWNDTGFLLRRPITRSDWRKIDSLNIK